MRRGILLCVLLLGAGLPVFLDRGSHGRRRTARIDDGADRAPSAPQLVSAGQRDVILRWVPRGRYLLAEHGVPTPREWTLEVPRQTTLRMD